MKTIDKVEVVQSVRLCLDEMSKNEAGFSIGEDDSNLDALIEGKMSDGWRYVLSNAKSELIDPKMVTKVTAERDGLTKNAEALVDDMLRFLWGYSPKWPYAVSSPFMWTDPAYTELSNPRLTGTPDRPKVGISPSYSVGDVTSGTYSITLYGTVRDVSDEGGSGTVGYVKDVDSVVGQTMTETLYSAFIYCVAGMVLVSLRDSQHAENFMAQAMAMIGADKPDNTQ